MSESEIQEKVNEVVRETLADELERLSDPRLGLVTITGVDVSPDLRQATVYYSAFVTGGAPREVGVTTQGEGREQAGLALQSTSPHLRAALGRQVRMKYVPELTFREDPAVIDGARIEEIIRGLHHADSPGAAVESGAALEPGAAGAVPVEDER